MIWTCSARASLNWSARNLLFWAVLRLQLGLELRMSVREIDRSLDRSFKRLGSCTCAEHVCALRLVVWKKQCWLCRKRERTSIYCKSLMLCWPIHPLRPPPYMDFVALWQHHLTSSFALLSRQRALSLECKHMSFWSACWCDAVIPLGRDSLHVGRGYHVGTKYVATVWTVKLKWLVFQNKFLNLHFSWLQLWLLLDNRRVLQT